MDDVFTTFEWHQQVDGYIFVVFVDAVCVAVVNMTIPRYILQWRDFHKLCCFWWVTMVWWSSHQRPVRIFAEAIFLFLF